MVTDEQRRQERAQLQRMQLAAAIGLGLVVLVVIVLRAWLGGGLGPGWWRL
jgi:hypothetical protein